MATDSTSVTRLGDLVKLNTEQTNPSAHPNVVFEHYSIPAYDAGQRATIELGVEVKSNKFTVPNDAILLSKLNPRINRVWTPKVSNRPAITSTEFLVLTPKPGVDRRFLHYLLQSPSFRANLTARVTGTSGSHQRVRPLDVLDIPVAAPPFAIQQSISYVLGSLDDKIELNRRMSETLEQIELAILKAWFVDFLPSRLKSRGVLTGLPAEIDAEFPASLVAAEGGEIPAGWELVRFGEILNERSERVGDRSVPAYSSTNAGLMPRTDRFKKQLSLSMAKNKLIERGDLVFGLSRQVLNYGVMHDEVGSVSPAYRVYQVDRTKLLPELLHGIMRLRSAHFYSLVSASSREGQSISPAAVNTLPLVLPPPQLQHLYRLFTQALTQRQSLCVEETETLANLRDTLLPKLLSGELRVPQAERLVSEVV